MPERSLRRKVWGGLMRGLMWAAAGLTCALLVFLIGCIFLRGLPKISWQLLSTAPSYLQNTIGILPNLVNTLYLVVVAMLAALPLGVGAAIYLTEYAKSRTLVRIIEFAAETLSGIPSILFGLVGMLVFTQLMGLRAGILAGGLTLAVMILPTVIRTTQESLRTVPSPTARARWPWARANSTWCARWSCPAPSTASSRAASWPWAAWWASRRPCSSRRASAWP